MPKFSPSSLECLESCHPELQLLFNEVIKYFDCAVLEGFRNEEAQNKAFAEGKSKQRWPNGNHNKNPSWAVDVSPYPIDWGDKKRFYYFAGWVEGIAKMLKQDGRMIHTIRYGGDWDGDRDLNDQSFNDLVHFELRP